MREDGVESAHRSVAHDLRDDRRGCDRGTSLVAIDDRLVLRRERTEAKPVDEARLGRRCESGQRLPEAAEVRTVQPVAVDRRRRDHADRDPLGAARNRSEQRLTTLVRDLLRVVQEPERPDGVVAQLLVVEEHARHDERPRKAAASRLVRTRDETNPEPFDRRRGACGRFDARGERIDADTGRVRRATHTRHTHDAES